MKIQVITAIIGGWLVVAADQRYASENEHLQSCSQQGGYWQTSFLKLSLTFNC